METATTVKRPRGRPRIDAPPRPAVLVRLPPALKAQLERDAKKAKRSVTKEIEVRLDKSYLRDELYGGSQMASMFREMAEVSLGVARQKDRGSFFEDFEVFVFVREIWQIILQRQMPRPRDELLAEVGREWDAFKAGAPQTPAQHAAREWLIRHTPMTLVQVLARVLEPAISRPAGRREPASDIPAKTPEAAETGDPNLSQQPVFGVGEVPLIASLGKAMEHLIPSEDAAAPAAFVGSAVWPIGNIAKAMEGLVPSQGSVRAAAGEVSRLAQLLADSTEESGIGGTAVPPIGPEASEEEKRCPS